MNNKLEKILAEISAGELIDKITILEIKNIVIKPFQLGKVFCFLTRLFIPL
jgi:hypothetical protein